MFEINKESFEAAARRLGLAASLATAAFALTPAASAAEHAPGMRVVKDPITGQLRAPTAQEAAELSGASSPKSMRQMPRGLITGKVNPAAITHPDGTVEQELDESSMQYTVVTRNTDGSLSTVCVAGNEAADAVLSGKKAGNKVAKASQEHNHDHK